MTLDVDIDLDVDVDIPGSILAYTLLVDATSSGLRPASEKNIKMEYSFPPRHDVEYTIVVVWVSAVGSSAENVVVVGPVPAGMVTTVSPDEVTIVTVLVAVVVGGAVGLVVSVAAARDVGVPQPTPKKLRASCRERETADQMLGLGSRTPIKTRKKKAKKQQVR